MTFEERIDRLTERHEALTQSAELLLLEIGTMKELAALHSEQLEKDGEHIRALALIAEAHQHRIKGLEEGLQ